MDVKSRVALLMSILPITFGQAWDEMLVKYRKEFPKLRVLSFEDSKILSYLSKHGWGMAGVTLYNTIYLRKDYLGTDRGIEIMKHEMAHVRDVHKWNILYLISYFLILPTVLSMRAFWEWRGYREDLKSVREQYEFAEPSYRDYIYDYYAQWVTSQFTSASYFYMLPFRGIVYKWCQNTLKSQKK